MVLTAGMKRDTLHILTAVAGLTLMATTVTGADKASRKIGIGPSFKGPIGLQLYSLREQFAKDVPATLAQAQNFGFKYVELAGTYGQPPEKFKSMLTEHGLVPVANQYKWCSAAWFERVATPAMVQTIYSFKTDQVHVEDDY